MSGTPLSRLRRRLDSLGAPLCVGVDPHPDHLPDDLSRDVRGIETFARGLVAVAGEHAVAVKLNVAFFEAFGAAGWGALERVRAAVPADLVCILDAKRGDIGPTAERYATALFDHLAGDAVTLSPYLGTDAVDPFLAYPDRLVYLLARTSNPSAGQLQGLSAGAGGGALYEEVARWAVAHLPPERVGLVVGATAPAELAALRRAVPEPGFLVPGIGAQGGDLGAAVEHCHGTLAPGVVSVSRSIAQASRGRDWERAAARAAASLASGMREVGARLNV